LSWAAIPFRGNNIYQRIQVVLLKSNSILSRRRALIPSRQETFQSAATPVLGAIINPQSAAKVSGQTKP